MVQNKATRLWFCSFIFLQYLFQKNTYSLTSSFLSVSIKVVTLQLLIIILIIIPVPFFKSFLLFVCSFCFSFSAFADEKDEIYANVFYRTASKPNIIQESDDAALLARSMLIQTECHVLFPKLPERKSHFDRLPLRTYQLSPRPGDLDFLSEIMPIVNQLSILNNKFGIGVGFKMF